MRLVEKVGMARSAHRQRQEGDRGLLVTPRLGMVDVMRLVHSLEQFRQGFGGFRIAKKKIAARLHGVMKNIENGVLDLALQIDQQIAARD